MGGIPMKKRLRNFLDLKAYLHKYFYNYAYMTVHLSHLLKKNQKWVYIADYQRSFESITSAWYDRHF